MDEELLKGKALLVVDDEVDLREIVASELEYMGAKVYQAENVAAAKVILNAHKVDLVVSDIRMPGGTGIDLLNYIKSQKANVPPVILITGFADITVEDAYDQGAEALLNKPFKLEELIQIAVKLTSPAQERYVKEAGKLNKELDYFFPENLTQSLSSKECAIGRGGMTLTVDMEKVYKRNSGELLKFNIKFEDVEFFGTGICRWWKTKENSSLATVGLEFVQLSDQTFNFFHRYWQDHSIVSFIPRLEERR